MVGQLTEQLLTLTEWDQRTFAKPHAKNTLRGWVRRGLIQPKPELVGREYLVKPNARYIPEVKQADDVVMEVVFGKTA